MKGGYGLVSRDIMRNKKLTPEAKAIYAYLSSIAGKSGECYPSASLMMEELGMGNTRFYKHVDLLVDMGVIERKQQRDKNRWSKTIYVLTHTMNDTCIQNESTQDTYTQCTYTQNESTQNESTQFESSQNRTINNNSINNNSTKSNSINYQEIIDLYNDTCVSFPRCTKLSEKRKKAIRARLRTYSIDDIKQVYKLAEQSDFLKGSNNHNWSANFDWLITDSNMAKVLDGNYNNKTAANHQSNTTADIPKVTFR